MVLLPHALHAGQRAVGLGEGRLAGGQGPAGGRQAGRQAQGAGARTRHIGARGHLSRLGAQLADGRQRGVAAPRPRGRQFPAGASHRHARHVPHRRPQSHQLAPAPRRRARRDMRRRLAAARRRGLLPLAAAAGSVPGVARGSQTPCCASKRRGAGAWPAAAAACGGAPPGTLQLHLRQRRRLPLDAPLKLLAAQGVRVVHPRLLLQHLCQHLQGGHAAGPRPASSAGKARPKHGARARDRDGGQGKARQRGACTALPCIAS